MSRPDGHRDGDSCAREFGPGVHNLGSTPAPAAPAAEADLRAEVIRCLESTFPEDRQADALLAGPLQRLVEQAAEAARLRETVEALVERWESSGRHYAKRADQTQTKTSELIYRLSGASLTEQAETLRRALDGEGTDG